MISAIDKEICYILNLTLLKFCEFLHLKILYIEKYSYRAAFTLGLKRRKKLGVAIQVLHRAQHKSFVFFTANCMQKKILERVPK